MQSSNLKPQTSILLLTFSDGVDVSQIFTTDLCYVLHHKDLPGQLVQEASCYEWSFTGEHNLLQAVKKKKMHGMVLLNYNTLKNFYLAEIL